MSEWNEPPQQTQSQPAPSQKESKEWALIEKTVMAHTRELQKSRRWGIFFKIMTFVYLFALLLIFRAGFDTGSAKTSSADGHVAVVQVRGVMSDGEDASANNIIGGLRAAFKDKNTKAVVLKINSPGGSPVQAGYIYDEIQRLRELHEDVPVYAVIADVGASAAYYISAAADEIYADKASVVGSIGVTAAGFGFAEAMEKIGVERRQFTAGDHKAFLDPYSPLDPDEKVFFQNLLDGLHQQFIGKVKEGRGDKLADNPDIFSGLFWSGEQAVELGLVDGLKSTSQLARELGYEDLIDFTPKPSPLEQITKDLGISLAEGLYSIMTREQSLDLR